MDNNLLQTTRSIVLSCGCVQSNVSDVLRAARARQLARLLPEGTSHIWLSKKIWL